MGKDNRVVEDASPKPPPSTPSTSRRGISRLFFAAIFVDLFCVALVVPLMAQHMTIVSASSSSWTSGKSAASPNAAVFGAVQAIYGLMQVLSTPIMGRLADTIGKKTVLMISLGGTALAYAILSLSLHVASMPLFILSRVVVGGLRQTLTVSSAYVAEAYGEEEKAPASGGEASQTDENKEDINSAEDRTKGKKNQNRGKKTNSSNNVNQNSDDVTGSRSLEATLKSASSSLMGTLRRKLSWERKRSHARVARVAGGMSVLHACMSLGFMTGPVIGGALAHRLGAVAPVLLSASLDALNTIVIYFIVESPPPPPPDDVVVTPPPLSPTAENSPSSKLLPDITALQSNSDSDSGSSDSSVDERLAATARQGLQLEVSLADTASDPAALIASRSLSSYRASHYSKKASTAASFSGQNKARKVSTLADAKPTSTAQEEKSKPDHRAGSGASPTTAADVAATSPTSPTPLKRSSNPLRFVWDLLWASKDSEPRLLLLSMFLFSNAAITLQSSLSTVMAELFGASPLASGSIVSAAAGTSSFVLLFVMPWATRTIAPTGIAVITALGCVGLYTAAFSAPTFAAFAVLDVLASVLHGAHSAVAKARFSGLFPPTMAGEALAVVFSLDGANRVVAPLLTGFLVQSIGSGAVATSSTASTAAEAMVSPSGATSSPSSFLHWAVYHVLHTTLMVSRVFWCAAATSFDQTVLPPIQSVIAAAVAVLEEYGPLRAVFLGPLQTLFTPLSSTSASSGEQRGAQLAPLFCSPASLPALVGSAGSTSTMVVDLAFLTAHRQRVALLVAAGVSVAATLVLLIGLLVAKLRSSKQH